ncbi:hypothetical protein C8J56DRAFT_1156428 [Mycena floridula]|nr:hypothetical protein C8J56DRAFT_1156428 [Mycena floridula]
MPDPSVFLNIQDDFNSDSAARARLQRHQKKMKLKAWRRMNCHKKTDGEEKIVALPKGCPIMSADDDDDNDDDD